MEKCQPARRLPGGLGPAGPVPQGSAPGGTGRIRGRSHSIMRNPAPNDARDCFTTGRRVAARPRGRRAEEWVTCANLARRRCRSKHNGCFSCGNFIANDDSREGGARVVRKP